MKLCFGVICDFETCIGSSICEWLFKFYFVSKYFLLAKEGFDPVYLESIPKNIFHHGQLIHCSVNMDEDSTETRSVTVDSRCIPIVSCDLDLVSKVKMGYNRAIR